MPVTNPAPAAEAWSAATLQNGWVNYGSDGTGTYAPAGYFRDFHQVVTLRGGVKSGTIGQAMFTLPTGYRPPYRIVLSAYSWSAGTGTVFSRVDIAPNGQVIPMTGGNGFFCLDGISFRAS
jgi:hypothetical protein